MHRSQMSWDIVSWAKLDTIHISNLKDLLEHEAITEIEFKVKLREIMNNM